MPIGAFSLKDWQDTVDLMTKYQELKTDKKPSDFFSNDFLPKPKT
jgi:hypothetical protein